MRHRLLVLAAAAGLLSACDPNGPRPAQSTTNDSVAGATTGAVPHSDWFVDRASASGLDFVHVNGMSGQMYIVEIMGPGVALVDYDNDGDLDVYAVQGQPLVPRGAAGTSGAARGAGAARSAYGPAPSSASRGDRLYRNDLDVRADGSRVLRFTDVTAQAGVDVRSYGMGVAAGDVNNDGWTDLYLTRFGPDVLLRNNGNGTFTDATARSGLSDSGWTVPASFFDFDRDGWLDLYVGSYLRYALESDIRCYGSTGARDYCSPQNYSALPGRLYRNGRNGTFADVTVAAGLARDYGPALGSLAMDANADGWLDLYVANDGSANQLWVNRRNGTFENTAVLAGVAVNGDGRAEGSMGVDAGDFDDDGDDDLLVVNLTGEGSTLYASDGAGVFEDVGAASGLRSASLPYTGFGTAWIDVDNDALLDVLTVNGAIQTIQSLAQAGDGFPLHQRKQLFRNRGDRRFDDVTARAGRAFEASDVSRGAAFGDVDNDGDMDVLVGVNNGPLRLLINQEGQKRRWIGVRAIGIGGRDMLGARVGVVTADATKADAVKADSLKVDGTTRWRRVRTDGSYASANDGRVLFGLGSVRDVSRVRIEWPDGTTEEWAQTGVDRWITLRQGTGR